MPFTAYHLTREGNLRRGIDEQLGRSSPGSGWYRCCCRFVSSAESRHPHRIGCQSPYRSFIRTRLHNPVLQLLRPITPIPWHGSPLGEPEHVYRNLDSFLLRTAITMSWCESDAPSPSSWKLCSNWSGPRDDDDNGGMLTCF
jgi:hypothetical protein